MYYQVCFRLVRKLLTEKYEKTKMFAKNTKIFFFSTLKKLNYQLVVLYIFLHKLEKC